MIPASLILNLVGLNLIVNSAAIHPCFHKSTHRSLIKSSCLITELKINKVKKYSTFDNLKAIVSASCEGLKQRVANIDRSL